MKRIEMMLDLEYMGKPPTAAIVAIGAALIDRDALEVLGKFHMNVSLSSSIESGGTVDPSTVIWWMGQPDEVRQQLMDPCAASIRTGLNALHSFITGTMCGEDYELTHVWGYGATSDNMIIRTAHERIGLNSWDFRVDSCFRTMTRQLDVVPWVDYGVPHVAGDDAMAQALTLIEMYKAKK